jgi:hypothetical protein
VNNWLGLVWSEVKGKYVRDENLRPIMNLNGAVWCVGVLKTYTRNNNIMTDISKEDYVIIMGDIIENVWLNLGTRVEGLGVKNDGDLIRVCNELEHAAALVLMGAGDGKYNKFLSTTVSRHETLSTANQPMGNNSGLMSNVTTQSKKGVFDKMKDMVLGVKE